LSRAANDAPAPPIEAGEFAGLMRHFVPFERAPRLAVACSGGADSLALALLADQWARAQGGTITALTVDHRLRPEAAAEAAQVAAWLGARGIAHVTLVRAGARPASDVQAAARAARYRLLEAWCAAEGVLHLLTAHHREDQAETVLLRLARGSGLAGLAGVSAVSERSACRVLRPLLATPRARLLATLAAWRQDWIDDPSNLDPAFARARVRQSASVLDAEGLTAERLSATARAMARARNAIEHAVVQHLARAVWLDPAGFAWLDPARLAGVPDEVGLRGLAAVIATVAGSDYPPRLEGLERLHRDLPAALGGGRTLGGCRVLPRRGRVLVCREEAAAAPPVAARPGTITGWDGRFRLHLPASAPAGLMLGALGRAPLSPAGERTVPAAARPTLPALRDARGPLVVPHLAWHREDTPPDAFTGLTLAYRPTRGLVQGDFTVV